MMRQENGAAGPTWRQLLAEGTKLLSAAGVAEAELDAWFLLSAAFGIDRIHYFMDQNTAVRTERLEAGYGTYRAGLEKRAARIPLQQILGSQEFMGLEFFVNEHVLIPRQDTEKLVETVLKEQREKDISLLDMCTGSGCIALSLAVLGGYRKVTAADISKDALEVARKNARRLFLIQKGTVRSQSFTVSEKPWKMELKTWVVGTAAAPGTEAVPGREAVPSGRQSLKNAVQQAEEHSFTLLQSNLFEEIRHGELYDVIVSNPPYIPSAVIDGLEPEVRDHEPRLALDGKEDGLYFYRALALECSKHLRTGGMVYFEIGYDQSADVEKILALAGYREIETIKDEPGLDRVVKARWNR